MNLEAQVRLATLIAKLTEVIQQQAMLVRYQHYMLHQHGVVSKLSQHDANLLDTMTRDINTLRHQTYQLVREAQETLLHANEGPTDEASN